jgi:predicted nucleic acid-binding protein
MRHIFLDSSPLGLISRPAKSPQVIAIVDWATDCLAAGHEIYIPEVIHYEIRRELIRAKKSSGLRRLERLKSAFRYVPINTAAMTLAADLWAKSRQSGFTTGDPKKLDIDVILAAQALTLGVPLNDLIVATENAKHLSRFVSADEWQNIRP